MSIRMVVAIWTAYQVPYSSTQMLAVNESAHSMVADEKYETRRKHWYVEPFLEQVSVSKYLPVCPALK